MLSCFPRDDATSSDESYMWVKDSKSEFPPQKRGWINDGSTCILPLSHIIYVGWTAAFGINRHLRRPRGDGWFAALDALQLGSRVAGRCWLSLAVRSVLVVDDSAAQKKSGWEYVILCNCWQHERKTCDVTFQTKSWWFSGWFSGICRHVWFEITEVHGDPGGRSPLQRAGAFELWRPKEPRLCGLAKLIPVDVTGE